MSAIARNKDVERIVSALQAGAEVYRSRSMDSVRVEKKIGGDPVTDAEREVNDLLHRMLVEEGEGWLSEESADSQGRLTRSRVWLVDPLDGTKEYVSSIPEWCISVALLEEGRLVAAGVMNPATDELYCGTLEAGLLSSNRSNGGQINTCEPLVLGSRSEVKRGEWARFRESKFRMQPMGSVAYKLALVAAGKADATWTLVPKHEWDVAAGVALVQFSGGLVVGLNGQLPEFNQVEPLLPGLVGFSASGVERLRPFLSDVISSPVFGDCYPWAKVLFGSAASTPAAS